MPLTEKGETIKGAMQEQYGPERGEEVFYASANKGTITGVEQDQPPPRVDPRMEYVPQRSVPEDNAGGAFFPGELTARREEPVEPWNRAEEDWDAGALLSASGSPGRAFGGGGARRDHGWMGDGPFGSQAPRGRLDEYVDPGVGQMVSRETPQQAEPTGDYSETVTQRVDYGNIGVSPGGGGGGTTSPQPQQQAAPMTGDQPEIEEERNWPPEEDCGDSPSSIGVLPEGLPPETMRHPQEYPGASTPPAPFNDALPMRPAFGGWKSPTPTVDVGVGYGGITGGVFKQDWGDQNPHPFADQLPGGMSTNEIQNWGRDHFWNQWLPKG